MKKNNMDKYAELFGDLESSHFKKDTELSEVKLDNEDIYNKETEPVKTEEVREVIVENELQLSEASKAAKRLAKGRGKPGDTATPEELESYRNGRTASKYVNIARNASEDSDLQLGALNGARYYIRQGVNNSEYSKQQNQTKKDYRKGLKKRINSSYEKGDIVAAEQREKILKNITEEISVENLSDFDIFCLLEEAGIEITLANLDKVKSGDIVLVKEPEKCEAPVEEPKEEKVEKLEDNHIEVPSEVDNKKVFSDKVHHNMVDVPKKDNKYEAFKNRFSEKSGELLESYLVEDCGMNLKEAIQLNEDEKVQSIKEIALLLLQSINEKLERIDTTVADRSKGDIKQVRNLPEIQDAITNLEELISRSDSYNPSAKEYVGIVIKSILFINQYSNVFKEAYRNKKVLLIMKYQSLILSIISAVSYLISVLVDFSDGVKMREVIEIEKIAPIKTLEDFNKSVESGEFKIITKDMTIMREHYTEVSVENLSKLYEATDYLPMIVDSVKNLIGNLSNSGRLTNLVYKATGLITLLFSLRDVMYMLYRMKTKVSDMLGGISNFANMNMGGSLAKLINFSNLYKVDAETSSEISSREIQDENRTLLTQVKQIQQNVNKVEPAEVNGDDNNKIPAEDNNELGFSFDF